MLRRATTKDIPQLSDLRKCQLADEGLASEADIDEELRAWFERTLGDNSLVEWVFEEEGEIVATAGVVFMPFPPTYTNPVSIRGYVTNMYTAPNFRGKGIATKLLHRLVDEARARGAHLLLLSAAEMGRPVYERCGFREREGWMELSL